MARYRWDKKGTVEQYIFLSTTILKGYGYFKSMGSKFGTIRWFNHQDAVIASICFQVNLMENIGKVQLFNEGYSIGLVATPCYFGGKRWWFICPLMKDGVVCGRRAGKLYLGEKYLGCRHCYSLTYRSCQTHDARVDRIRKSPRLIALYLNHPNPRKSILGLQAALKIKGLV